jgi:geranylgeranyl pyrophosphate synthase
MTKVLIDAIESALRKSCHHPELLRVMDYAVLPAGKLFRPRLVEALALDLTKTLSKDHLHLASAIELHHAYTLVHDDLPSMDNDLLRRGKPSTHAHFGEWKAILAGDALLIASFNELANISHKNFQSILKLMTWTTGAKGLIEGQFRDLGADSDIIRIHELKTGRLIQLATLGTYLLMDEQTLQGKMAFLRLGREIGLTFQLLDDLNELADETLSPHEKVINPFINKTEDAFVALKLSHSRITSITAKHGLNLVQTMLVDYFSANKENLIKNFMLIERHIGRDLSLLRKWLTTFV